MFGNIFTVIKQFKKIVNGNTLVQLLVFVILSVFLSTWILYHVERPVNSDFTGWFECFWAATIGVTAGYSDGFAPKTNTGMVIMIYLTLLGMGAVGTFIAWIASIFVEYRLKEGMGLGQVSLKNHIIICGWSFKAEEMIKQLRSDDISEQKEVVILAELDNSPIRKTEGVHFISGEPTREEHLRRAGIMNCSCAIILAEITAENRSSSMPDSKSILTVLTIESLRPEVYTVAEVLDPCNIPHFKRANVDEIVASSEFTGKLLVQATLNHGITSLFENMLTFSEGSEIYKFSVPRGLAGLTFREVHLKMFDKEYNVIAMEKQEKIILHPATTTRVEAEDFLYGICETEPLQEQLDSLFTPQQS